MACSGIEMGSFHLFRHPKRSRMVFGTTDFFDPFWTHFWSQNGPLSRHFEILGGPQHATTSSKRAGNTSLGISWGPGSFLKKSFFCTKGTLLTNFATHLFGLPATTCRNPLGLGTGT